MADLVYPFGRTILEGMFRENLLGLPLWRHGTRPPGFLVRGWSQELNGSARCSGDTLIAPTAPHRPMDEPFHQNDPDGNRTPDLPLVSRDALYQLS
eukprot:scaffold126121_cov36-Phaeocystis_antarctica.AAC.2